jgi:hypothetical protein
MVGRGTHRTVVLDEREWQSLVCCHPERGIRILPATNDYCTQKTFTLNVRYFLGFSLIDFSSSRVSTSI